MPVLCDTQIKELIRIEPFAEGVKRPGSVSYGLSSYGYDVRVGSRFKIFTPTPRSGGIAVVDPKNFTDDLFVEVDADAPVLSRSRDRKIAEGPGASSASAPDRVLPNAAPSSSGSSSIESVAEGRGYVIIPPNSFALCETIETFTIPRDVLVLCVGKSTYARCGLIVNVTPLEPEWRGKITIEISNTTPLPAKVYANEGIAQLVFLKADKVCAVSYADKNGKYQDQGGLTLPRVD